MFLHILLCMLSCFTYSETSATGSVSFTDADTCSRRKSPELSSSVLELESAPSSVPRTILEEINLEKPSDKQYPTLKEVVSVQLGALYISRAKSLITCHLSLRLTFETHISNISAYFSA